MSSFVGHSLAAVTICAVSNRRLDPKRIGQLIWLGWLWFIACLPDVDYLIKALRLNIDGETIRITHSFSGALLFPVITIVLLWVINPLTHKFSTASLSRMSLQLMVAGLSHLVLDLSTGVSSLPLVYPLSNKLFKLSFGLLPSAGRLQP